VNPPVSETTFAEFVRLLQGRRAVKRFDAGFRIAESELYEILEAATRAPSSWNLQHWKFLLITSDEAKARLFPVANRQRQVLEASAVVAVLGDLEPYRNADAVFGMSVDAGFMTPETKASLVEQTRAAYEDARYARDEAIRNASLAAMILMLAARAKGLDTCPMGGFSRSRFVEAFRVPPRYLPVLLVAVGKAAEPPQRPSLRLPVRDVVVRETF